MKTRVKYYWQCTYLAAGGEKSVIIGYGKTNTNTMKFFRSPESAAKFLKRSGLADKMHLGECKCVLQEVEV